MAIEDTEEIEGLSKDEDASLGDYPIDTLLIRNETRTIHDVTRRIDKGFFIMAPDFQRDFVWEEDKQSKLIESVLMRIPLPVFYLGEDNDGKMIVVDGLQRLTTFKRFLDNDFRLKLPKQPELNKKLFKELSSKLQNRIEDCNLILYVIDAKVPERARLDIFERVNSGEPLTRQQMRNCLYSGKATQFLKKESETDLFKKVTANSLKPKTMRDRECVNRFCAFFLLPLDSYRGDMDEWLAESLRTMNQLDETQLITLSRTFQNALKNNFILFQEQAFRKHSPIQSRRGVLNISLWDVMTTGLANYSEEEINDHAPEIRDHFYELLSDEDFTSSITLGTNSARNVTFRFKKIREMVQEIFHA
ncbi:DUF262 domain-containing protein [Methylomonas albis]|uniref:DUF262 domain-containing protein n=2 Tax=Methylomonas albis TaxID=1854563 RepID=A0ABR9D7J6_9GAMM|nr:DUF262 domain-containing protein [Methylomonas albis]MBD9358930.1 DUF262 domain-containing protein [Methylomonas albis]